MFTVETAVYVDSEPFCTFSEQVVIVLHSSGTGEANAHADSDLFWTLLNNFILFRLLDIGEAGAHAESEPFFTCSMEI